MSSKLLDRHCSRVSQLVLATFIVAIGFASSYQAAVADIVTIEVNDYVPGVNEFGGSFLDRAWQPSFILGQDLAVGDIISLKVTLDECFAIRLTNTNEGGVNESVSIGVRHNGLGRRGASNAFKMKLEFSDGTDFEFADEAIGSGINVSQLANFIPNGTSKDLVQFELLLETMDNPPWQTGVANFEFGANEVERVSVKAVPEPTHGLALVSSLLAIAFFRRRSLS